MCLRQISLGDTGTISSTPRRRGMVLWIFGYGSLIWKAGFEYDERVEGYVVGYRRVFYQGSTDHRGTEASPGRTVTLEPSAGQITWGAIYGIHEEVKQQEALNYLEVREKQYDVRLKTDFFTRESSEAPFATNVLVFVGSTDVTRNRNYLGYAPDEAIAKQIAFARGPSGPNSEYLFQLEKALKNMGVVDEHVEELSQLVRKFQTKELY